MNAPGVALVRITGYILLVSLALIGHLPFQAGGEAAAAPAAQARFFEDLDDILRAKLSQALGQRRIAVKGDVFFNILRVNLAAVAQGNTMLLLVEGHLVQGGVRLRLRAVLLVDQPLDNTALEQMLLDDLVNVTRGYMGIERAFRVHNDHGANFTEPEAAGAHHFDFLIQTLFGNLGFQAGNDLRRTGRGATGSARRPLLGNETDP